MKDYFDNKELKLILEAAELLEVLGEKKRILVSCAKSNRINDVYVSQLALEFSKLQEIVHEFNKNKLFLFYRKYNFFKSGIMVEFLN